MVQAQFEACICVMARAVPNKKGMGAAFALLGSTFSGLVRYWFGRWIPTFEQLMYSKVKPHRCLEMALQHHTYLQLACMAEPKSHYQHLGMPAYCAVLYMSQAGHVHHEP